MGCGESFIEFTKDAFEDTRDLATGETFRDLVGFDDIKKGWDDLRGATYRKETEKAAQEAEKARLQAKTFERGAKQSPRKTQKAGTGRGARGTRLVRQPLGTYTPSA